MASEGEIVVIASDGPPISDLAREAWLLEQAATGRPSLFVTSWAGPVVALGYGQDAAGLDLDFCRDHSIPVLRRLTGGTGVVHQGDLGVGLALPQDHPWAAGIVSLYGRFLDTLEPALRSLGSRVSRLDDPAHAGRVRSPICFLDQLSDTLVVDDKKAVGCAQTRRKGSVLIHAAVLLGLDAELYEAVFRVPSSEVRAGLAPALEGVSWRDVGEAVTAGLASALGLEPHRSDPEPVPEQFLQPYTTERWAPVLPDPNNLSSRAKPSDG
jgi:lipoate-protein ligase A